MKEEIMDLRRFQRRFQTEKACVEHLFKLRWPNGYRCPKCGHCHYSFHSTRKLYQCSGCKYQVSITAGTVFHKTRTPLVQWFWMIFIMTRQKSGVSMLSLQGMLGIKTYRTVWAMSHKIRKAMADRDAQYQLTGLVETLQAFLKPTKTISGRNRPKSGPSIVVAVESRGDSPGFARMRHVPAGAPEQDNSAVLDTQNFNGIALRHERRSDSGEDLNESYLELNPLLIDDRKPTRIRWARILMANLTGNIRGVHHGVSEKHLHRYLAEFLYRFNRRAWSAKLLNGTLSACLSASTITYAELRI